MHQNMSGMCTTSINNYNKEGANLERVSWPVMYNHDQPHKATSFSKPQMNEIYSLDLEERIWTRLVM